MGVLNLRKTISKSTSLPAPVGGLNAFDTIALMPEKDAIIMRNFFPETYGVTVRRGCRVQSEGLSGYVCTLMAHNNTTGDSRLFAVDQTDIWDVTSPGDVSGATPVRASSNPWWQYVSFGNAAGTHLIAFNGVDNGFWYSNGVVRELFALETPGPEPTEGEWVGIDPKKLVHVTAHQKRIWAVEKESTRGWYLEPEAVYGNAKSFDFGGCFTRGGYLQQLITWTTDSGFGPDDMLLAISSNGDVACYKGINPDSADTWALVGVYYVGATFTRRCATKFGGDVVFLTQYGVLTMNSILKGEEVITVNALSRKIQAVASELITAGSDRPGWSVHTYPAANMLIVNVPGVVLSQNMQLVCNLLTGAWTVFEGWQSLTFASLHASLFFATDSKVYRCWEGHLDFVPLTGDGGIPILAECQQAFSYFGSPGTLKHFKMLRPTVIYAGKFSYRAGANMDFDFETVPPPAATGTSNYGVWDESLWDTTDVWSGGSQSAKQWVSIVGIGFAAACRIRVETSSELTWVTTDWIIEDGGIV